MNSAARRAPATEASDADSRRATPIFRWVGGKQRLVPHLVDRLPSDFRNRRYVEPFFGAGSLFLATAPQVAVLADANAPLIETYRRIQTEPGSVSKHLEELKGYLSPTAYIRTRTAYNRGRPSALQAARFVYLNRTCFNGVFRVNTDGEFNVPRGNRVSPWFPDADVLVALSRSLSKAKLFASDFAMTLKLVTSTDFLYLDPPYPALSHTANFSRYTVDRFDWEQQELLAQSARRLADTGAAVMISNADTPRIRRLYKGFTIRSLPATRWVTCKKVKLQVRELVITSY